MEPNVQTIKFRGMNVKVIIKQGKPPGVPESNRPANSSNNQNAITSVIKNEETDDDEIKKEDSDHDHKPEVRKRKKHKRPRVPQGCVECDRVFKTKKSLAEHMQKVHGAQGKCFLLKIYVRGYG